METITDDDVANTIKSFLLQCNTEEEAHDKELFVIDSMTDAINILWATKHWNF